MGFDLKIANLGKDGDILQTARHEAMEVLENDRNLEKKENQVLLKQLLANKQTDFEWSSIS